VLCALLPLPVSMTSANRGVVKVMLSAPRNGAHLPLPILACVVHGHLAVNVRPFFTTGSIAMSISPLSFFVNRFYCLIPPPPPNLAARVRYW
jgi:hypothetical protein